jgi:D-alanyl-D-alanine carboxypeptidase
MKPLNNFLQGKNSHLFFVMLSFVFIASAALSLSKPDIFLTLTDAEELSLETKYFPPNPVLGQRTAFPILSAQGVIAIDMDSGVPLYEKNPDAPLLPASTTKIITALVSLDAYPLDTVLTVGKRANVDGQKMGLFIGEKMKVEDLLYGLLVYSANDAAETLAENYPGGYDAFIDAMNVKAKDLFMTNTHFDNPVGLDGDGQRSTARDLVRASEIAMRNPQFVKIVGTKEILITDATGKFSYDLKNLNQLLGVVPGVIGVKTGWTESARENLVTYVIRDQHRIMITLLGSQDRFGETKELIDWIFSNYKWTEVKYP